MLDYLDVVTLPFFQRALVLLLVLAVAAATVGMLVNLRKTAFLGDGMTHAVFPGLAVGFMIAGDAGLLPGALVAAIAAAVTMTLASRRGASDETSIAIVLTSFFSVGVVVVSTHKDSAGQLQELFFGRLLTVTEGQLVASIALVAASVALVAVQWRQQAFLAFDAAGAAAAGLPKLTLDLCLGIAVGLFVVAAAASLGVLLVLAILVVPAAAARAMTSRVQAAVAVAFLFAAVTASAGLLVALWGSIGLRTDLPPGATVVLCMVTAYLTVLGGSALRRHRGKAAEA